jgi:hypothetical protein
LQSYAAGERNFSRVDLSGVWVDKFISEEFRDSNSPFKLNLSGINLLNQSSDGGFSQKIIFWRCLMKSCAVETMAVRLNELKATPKDRIEIGIEIAEIMASS